jgi:osmotically inducible lipoprotein OsmB
MRRRSGGAQTAAFALAIVACKHPTAHFLKEICMKIQHTISMALAVSAISLSACSDMSPRDRNTTTGAVIGGAAGAVLSGGGAAATIGGAAVGGVIGNQVDPHKR